MFGIMAQQKGNLGEDTDYPKLTLMSIKKLRILVNDSSSRRNTSPFTSHIKHNAIQGELNEDRYQKRHLNVKMGKKGVRW